MITADSVSCAYGKKRVLHNISLTIKRGSLTVIIGANSCGKSTLLRSIAGINRFQGNVFLGDRSIRDFKPKKLAALLAFLPQQTSLPAGLRVDELVSRGRYPHQSAFRRWTENDQRIVEKALEDVHMLQVCHQTVDSLSGGQRQRALIAMILAQQTEVLLLDEPTTFLDISHQYETLELAAALNRQGKTLVLVLHDLNQAARYATDLYVMRDGQMIAGGPPKNVITESLIEHAFGIESRIIKDPEFGTPMVIPRKNK